MSVNKTSKIAISLPEDVLTVIEIQRQESGESRSQFFRRAVDMLLKHQREQELSEQYLRAYREMPETKREIAAARRNARAILSQEPWDEKG